MFLFLMQLTELTPQTVKAAGILFSHHENDSAAQLFQLMKKQWLEAALALRVSVERVVDRKALVLALGLQHLALEFNDCINACC